MDGRSAGTPFGASTIHAGRTAAVCPPTDGHHDRTNPAHHRRQPRHRRRHGPCWLRATAGTWRLNYRTGPPRPNRWRPRCVRWGVRHAPMPPTWPTRRQCGDVRSASTPRCRRCAAWSTTPGWWIGRRGWTRWTWRVAPHVRGQRRRHAAVRTVGGAAHELVAWRRRRGDRQSTCRAWRPRWASPGWYVDYAASKGGRHRHLHRGPGARAGHRGCASMRCARHHRHRHPRLGRRARPGPAIGAADPDAPPRPCRRSPRPSCGCCRMMPAYTTGAILDVSGGR